MDPVVVVGAGPTGLAAAVLLAQDGVGVVVLERHGAPYPLPRGVHLDDEVHRVLQRLGVADDFARLSRPAPGMRLLDPSHRVLAQFRRRPGAGAHGWPQANLFDQPDLEALLRSRLGALGVPVRYGAEVLRVGPTVAYRQDGAAHELAAAAVLACDGAGSPVREALGLGWRVLGPAQPWMVVDVRTSSPLPVWDGVSQLCDPERPATFLRVGADRYRVELRLGAGETADDRLTEVGLAGLLEPWTGSPPADLEVLRVGEYVFRAGVARRWRRGRVLLLGDAAHQTPPFTGQGLGAGLRDADDLSWKLTRVLRDGAPEALLDTYEQERAPHARSLVRLAVLVGRLMTAGGPRSAVARRLALRVLPLVPVLRARVLDSATPPRRRGPLAGRGPVGRLLPQPALADGRRLDDLLGRGFAVLTRVTPDDALRDLAGQLGAPLVGLGVQGPGLATVDDLPLVPGASAVVVRPDRAVLAVARSATPGAELWHTRAAALALVGASPGRVTQGRGAGVEAPP